MKFYLTFKTPDVLEQLADSLPDRADFREAQKFAIKFVEYSENVNIEFDTEAGTATVIKLK